MLLNVAGLKIAADAFLREFEPLSAGKSLPCRTIAGRAFSTSPPQAPARAAQAAAAIEAIADFAAATPEAITDHAAPAIADTAAPAPAAPSTSLARSCSLWRAFFLDFHFRCLRCLRYLRCLRFSTVASFEDSHYRVPIRFAWAAF